MSHLNTIEIESLVRKFRRDWNLVAELNTNFNQTVPSLLLFGATAVETTDLAQQVDNLLAATRVLNASAQELSNRLHGHEAAKVGE